MPRGRIIYPDFWHDSKIVKLTPLARLFYVGMWNYAYCDHGHLSDDPDDLKLKILPADSVDGVELVDELIGSGRVVRGSIDGGGTFLEIPTFGTWQKKDDPRWSTRCPICRNLEPRQTTTNHDRVLRGVERSGEETRGGEASSGARPPRHCPKHPTGTDKGCFACRDARLAQEDWDKQNKNKAPNIPKSAKADDGHRHKWDHDFCVICETRRQ